MLLSVLGNIVKDEGLTIPERETEVKLANGIVSDYKANKYNAPSIFTASLRPKPRTGSLKSLVSIEARLRKEQELLMLSNEDLQQIWYMFEKFSSDPSADEVRVNYDHYSMVLARCKELYGPQVRTYFKASTFLKFERDSNGCISANQFLTYLNHRCSMFHLRVELSMFDTESTGSLTSTQIEDYIASQIPNLPALEDMPPSFVPHYKRIAVRKLLFFHGKNGVVRIRDLSSSFVLQELLDLKYLPPQDDNLVANWFSLQSTQRLYNTFLTYDDDMNGLLSRAEFSGVGNYTMSQLFIQRIFEEHVMKQRTFSGRAKQPKDEMDLMAFTDFVLAWENCNHVAAIKYFFPIFDLEKQGFISASDMYTFFREINTMNVNVMNEYELNVYDVVNEFMDMIKPKTVGRITPEDLARCGTSGLFFRAFTDVKQFSDYNNREN